MATFGSVDLLAGAQIYDGAVTFLGEVSEESSAATFSPDSARLYWTSSSWILSARPDLVVSETTGFTELLRIPLPVSVAGPMAINVAGDRLFLIVQGGVAILEITP